MHHPVAEAVPIPSFSTVTLTQQVYEHLRQSILANAYLPGTPLPEEALANRLGVSRAPVREAIRRLAGDGLVTLTPRQAAVVSSLSTKQFLDAYRFREALEMLAVRLATPRISSGELQFLEQLQGEMRSAVPGRDLERFFTANGAFHKLFVERAANDYLKATYEPLVDQMRRYRSPSADLRGGLERSIDEHEAILDAIRAGDVDEAVRRVSEHVQVPQRLLEQSPDSIAQPKIVEPSVR